MSSDVRIVVVNQLPHLKKKKGRACMSFLMEIRIMQRTLNRRGVVLGDRVLICQHILQGVQRPVNRG